MKKFTCILLVIISLTSCLNNKFTIKGNIKGAEKQTIYLEKMNINGIKTIDSTKINWRNNFSFKQGRNEYPELYTLRINNNYIIVSVDSIETIEIEGHIDNFATNFTVENSPNTEYIRQLRESSINLQKDIVNLSYEEQDKIIAKHRKLAKDIIFKDTRSLSAYFAIHQTASGLYYFSPYDNDYLQYWSAVATAFNAYFPDYERTKELKRITLEAIRYKRLSERTTDIDPNYTIKTQGYINISYPDRSGNVKHLSSLIGKVIVLDFSAYGIPQAHIHTLYLRDIYNKYASKGLEIYQVSLDENKLFWLEQSQSTPWVCVRDNATPNTLSVITYNVTELPTMFLLNKEGDIIGRYTHDNLEKAIQELLK